MYFGGVLSWKTPRLSNILNQDLIASHYGLDFGQLDDSINAAIFNRALSNNNLLSTYVMLLCSPLLSLHHIRGNLSEIINYPKEVVPVAVMLKSLDAACVLLESTTLQLFEQHRQGIHNPSPYVAHRFPNAIKVDRSLLAHFNKKMMSGQTVQSGRRMGPHLSGGGPSGGDSEDLELVMELTPLALVQGVSETVVRDLLLPSTSDSEPLSSPAWRKIWAYFLYTTINSDKDADADNNVSQLSLCDEEVKSSLQISLWSRGVKVRHVHSLSDLCLVTLVQRTAHMAAVLRIALGSPPSLTNFNARGLTQSGSIGLESYRMAGLTGKGQVCGLADTGVDDMSCFFVDNSNHYNTDRTDRTGVVQALRRKVVQYVASADRTDYQGGHGTHVAGSIAGNSHSDYHNIDGIASEAKLAVFDIGLHDKLNVPSLMDEVFPAAYRAGARVHSDSWGSSYHYPYTEFSFDVDRYTHLHPDFLVVLAAGNYGEYGSRTVVPPADAKNAVSVGALELLDPLTDENLHALTVAWFSSIGPTSDGRVKPDVVAPGSVIMSAFASSESSQMTAALDRDKDNDKNVPKGSQSQGQGHCGTIGMSGTSMATPVVSGNALLVRQYFMDSAFWAKNCNPSQVFCSRGPFEPSGYLVKALLLHTGERVKQYSLPTFDYRTATDSYDLGSPPDMVQGFGALRLVNILPLPLTDGHQGLSPPLDLFVWDAVSFSEHQTQRWDVDLSSSAGRVNGHLPPIKITLVWYDPPAALASAAVLLIHDLDLLVVAPDGRRYWGNGVRGGDQNNPNEQVHLPSPPCEDNPCVYRVYVRAGVLPEGRSQSVALSMTTSGVVTGPIIDDDDEEVFVNRAQLMIRPRTQDVPPGSTSLPPPQPPAPVSPTTPSGLSSSVSVAIVANISMSADAYTFNGKIALEHENKHTSVVLLKHLDLRGVCVVPPSSLHIVHPDGIYDATIRWIGVQTEQSTTQVETAARAVNCLDELHVELLLRFQQSRHRFVFVSGQVDSSSSSSSSTTTIMSSLDMTMSPNHSSQSLDNPGVPLTGNAAAIEPRPSPLNRPSVESNILERNVSMSAVLQGNHYQEQHVVIGHSCALTHIDIALRFDAVSAWSSPSDLIFAIQDPSERKFVIIAAPELAHWPPDWYSTDNGTFKASFDVTSFSLSGTGNWTAAARNSYSLSGVVHYGIVVRMRFVCSPPSTNTTTAVTSVPTTAPSVSPTPSPSNQSPMRHVVKVPPVMLGVTRDSVKGSPLQQDRIRLEPFFDKGKQASFL
eukprot:gene8188-16835_t